MTSLLASLTVTHVGLAQRFMATSLFVDTRLVLKTRCPPVVLSPDRIERVLHNGDTVVLAANVSASSIHYASDACVESWKVMPVRTRVKRGSVCTDPYTSYQTYLDATHVREAWRLQGNHSTHVMVVDDGVADHFELPIYKRFQLGDTIYGNHGTAVAGVAAAQANQIGICGVAPASRIVDINLLSDTFVSDVTEAMAFDGEHMSWTGVYCNSWGPTDDGRCEGPGELVRDTLAHGVRHGRGGRGAIYIFAAGNGGVQENMNDDGYANHPTTLAVAALNGQDPAYFSEWGASIAVTAPGYQLLATAPESSFMYFYGTSASAPIVAGVINLMLSRNPQLNWRSVHAIIMASAARIGDESAYERNGVGRRFSYRLGAGIVDARRACALADQWVDVEERRNATVPLHVDLPLPVFMSLPVVEAMVVEQVQLCVAITSPDGGASRGGPIGVWIESPYGTRSILTRPTSRESVIAGCSYADWCFTSVKHWGEEARGVWTVSAESDVASRMVNATLTIWGHDAPFSFWGCA